MEPTLKQGGKLLKLITQSGRSAEWVQEHLLGSGAFTDILAVDDLKGIHRESHRRFLGLPPLTAPAPVTPPLLEHLGMVAVQAATDRFAARDHFVVDTGKGARVKIAWVSDNFRNWFLDKVEGTVVEETLRYAKLIRSSVDDGPIIAGLGRTAEVELAQVFALMERQKNGEPGVLLTDGRANIFYVRDVNGELRAVGAYWIASVAGWNVDAYSVGFLDRWHEGDRVFSRNSKGWTTLILCSPGPFNFCPSACE